MDDEVQGASFGPGSRPADHAASGVDGASRFDPSRTCLTPESHYEIGQDSARTLLVRVRFPFDIDDWAQGTSAIQDTPEGVEPLSDADRLRRYDERAAERKRISDLIHDQMEAVAADCYRVLLERDARIGEDRVEYGVRHARWRRTREGDRPAPAHVPADHWSRKLARSLRDRDGAEGGDANAAPVPKDRQARADRHRPETSTTSSQVRQRRSA